MEWIECKNKLPDHHQKVIFYVKNRGECFCGFFETISHSKNKKNIFYENLDNWWFEDEEITYWMPLPHKPKE